jgi:3D (Asp-Asp-Asp) domain-containing protein
MGGRIVVLAASVLAAGAGAVALALSGGDARAPSRPASTAVSARVRHERLVASLARSSTRLRAFPHRVHAPTVAKPSSTSTPPPAQSRCVSAPPPVPERPIDHRQWLSGVVITEYYPATERWFVGRRIAAPGLAGAYAADFLYSARGLAMEGDGVDQAGRRVHIAQLGSTGWVNASGAPTLPVCLGKWTNGFPVWLRGGWRNAHGEVTFPLVSGGWSNGPGVRSLPYGGVTFAPEPSTALHYYHSIAVDPRLIPLGSHVYVPAYRQLGGGWFVAQDTGGAIKGRHIDVYRPPPASPDDLGRYMTGQRILVIPPGA